MSHPQQTHQPNAVTPKEELDAALVQVSFQQNRIKNRSKRSPEWIFFADAGQWQTVNGEESKFRIANCRFCLKADIQTKIRGKIETMKNHILECDKIPADQKAIYERHPGRYRKRVSGSAQENAKRQKTEAALRSLGLTHVDGIENRAVVLHAARDMRIEKVPIPMLQPGHMLISMRSVGICGSVSCCATPWSHSKYFAVSLIVCSSFSGVFALHLHHICRMCTTGLKEESVNLLSKSQ